MEGLKFLESLAQWRGWGKWDLSRMEALMQELGSPQNAVKTFHVAGTNGKGSTSVGIAGILGYSGFGVLLNTSPHLVSVNERITIDGLQITNFDLNQTLMQVKAAASRLSIEPSHFEAVTAAAFISAKMLGMDYGVFEVGIGGRLDATNVISKPEVSLIVTIDIDHETQLGATVEKIAVEKAGIIKPNVPVIIGKMADAARWVIQKKASELGCKTYTFGEDFWIENSHAQGIWRFNSNELGEFDFRPSLEGEHQARNMAGAIAAARVAGIEGDCATNGVENIKWPGRLERCCYQDIEFIVDSAHNPAGIQALISFLDTSGLREVEVVFGAINTKRWREMIDLLVPFVKKWNLLTPNFAEAVNSSEVANYLSGIGINSTNYGSNYLKILDLFRLRKGADPLLVTGSMYMIGELKSVMGIQFPALWRRGGR